MLAFLRSDVAKRIFVWGAFSAAMVSLRSFYSVFLATYVLSLVGNQVIANAQNGFSRLQRFCKALRFIRPPRQAFVAMYILSVLTMITTATVLTVPAVMKEGQYLVRLGESNDPYLYVAESLHNMLGPEVIEKLENFLLAIAPTATNGVDASPSTAFRAVDVWTTERAQQLAASLQRLLKKYVVSLLRISKSLIQGSTRWLYTFIVSLLFSFLIVFDLPRVSNGVRSLGKSRLAFAYHELAPPIVGFSKILGTAFEVQILIAIANTILTSLGLVTLGIPAVGFLTLVVLICSFIPVAGVFMSTLPMCLVALTEYGFNKVVQVCGMVSLVHIVESYFIFPQMYASKLKLHPLLVLVALYGTEHLVGVQGLFLALPVTVYILNLIFDTDSLKVEGSQGEKKLDPSS